MYVSPVNWLKCNIFLSGCAFEWKLCRRQSRIDRHKHPSHSPVSPLFPHWACTEVNAPPFLTRQTIYWFLKRSISTNNGNLYRCTGKIYSNAISITINIEIESTKAIWGRSNIWMLQTVWRIILGMIWPHNSIEGNGKWDGMRNGRWRCLLCINFSHLIQKGYIMQCIPSLDEKLQLRLHVSVDAGSRHIA